MPIDPNELVSYPAPDIQTTINLNDQGLSQGDVIDGYLNSHMDDNTRIEIEPGTYLHEGSTFRGSYSDMEVVGLGEIGGVILEYPSEGWDSRPASLTASGGTVRLKNLTLKGTVNNDDHKFRIQADSGAEMILEHLWQPDGQIGEPLNERSEASAGLYAPSSAHQGTIRCLWCWVEGFGDNGAYLDGYAGSGSGRVVIVGGLYRNNNIANIRIGNDDSVIYRATAVQDASPDLSSNRVRNQRNIRIRQPGSNLSVVDTDIYHTLDSWNPFEIHSNSEGGSGTIENCRFRTESSNRVINAGWSADGSWTARNVHVTGGGRYDSNVTLEGNSCTGSGCDVARDHTQAWFNIDGDPVVGEPSEQQRVWQRRYTQQVDWFEDGSITQPWRTFQGSSFRFEGDEDTTLAPDSTRSLRMSGNEGSHGIVSEPGDGLYYYPERGQEHSYWFRQNAVNSTVENRVRFFLEEDNNEYYGYSTQISDGEIRLYKYETEPTDLLDSATIGYDANENYRVHIDSTENSITATVDTGEGTTELGSVTTTDTQYDGRGIMLWIPSGMDSSDVVWLDQWTNHSIEAPILVDNFNYDSLSDHYTSLSDITGGESETILEDFESYSEGQDLEDEGYGSDPNLFSVQSAAALHDTSTQGVRQDGTYGQLAKLGSSTPEGYTYACKVRVRESDDAPGFAICVQSSSNVNDEAYRIRLDHREQHIQFSVRGSTGDITEPYDVELDRTYELRIEFEDSEIYGHVIDVAADETTTVGPLSATAYSDGLWAIIGSRGTGAYFDHVRQITDGPSGDLDGAFSLSDETVLEADNSLEWTGSDDGSETITKTLDDISINGNELAASYWVSEDHTTGVKQLRFLVDDQDPENVFAAVELDYDNDEISLIASPDGEATETIDTEDHVFGHELWQGIRVEIDTTADPQFRVRVQADEDNESSTRVSGSHSSGSEIYGDDFGWHASGSDDGWFFDRAYLVGDDVVDIDPDPDPVPEPELWQNVATLSEARGRIWSIEWRPDVEDIAYGGIGAVGEGGDLFIHEVGNQWNSILDLQQDDHVLDISYSDDNEWLAVPNIAERLHILDSDSYEVEHTFGSGNHVGGLISVDFHPSSDLLFTGTSEGYVHIYDTSSTNPSNWSIVETINKSDESVIYGVRDLECSPDGQYVAFTVRETALYIYDAETFEQVVMFDDQDGNHRGVSWHPDSHRLAYAGGSGLIRIVDSTNSWSEIATLDEADDNTQFVDFAPNGKYIAYTARDEGPSQSMSVYIHRTEESDWAFETELDESDSRLFDVVFSPDNAYIAYSNDDGDVFIHNTPSTAGYRFEATAEMDFSLVESNVRSTWGDWDAPAAFDMGAVETAGPNWWHFRFDNETVITEGISPPITPTFTPGEETRISVVFDDDGGATEPFQERYNRLRKYQDVAARSAVRTSMTDSSKPIFREKLPVDTTIPSLVVAVIPGAGVPSGRGCWGVVTGITDRSEETTDQFRVIEVSVHVLATPFRKHANHEEVREKYSPKFTNGDAE